MVEEYISLLEPPMTVEPRQVLGRGKFGTVYSTEHPTTAVKVLIDPERFSTEHTAYTTASQHGFGAIYHGWCNLGDERYGIVIQRLERHLDVNNPAEIPQFTALLDSIARTGYFCGDFHAENLMITDTDELKLIDPSLVNTKEFIAKQITRGKLAESFGELNDEELANIAVGLMVDYVTHPSFGGIPLNSHPEYAVALCEFMAGKTTLRFVFKTGGWEYAEWSPQFVTAPTDV